MNVPYMLKIKYLLGLSHTNDIFDWAFGQVEHGNTNNEIFEILSLKEKDQGRIIEELSKIAVSQSIDKVEVKAYFYSLFISIFEKSIDIITIEDLLLKFYSLVKDDIDFDDDEKLSLTKVENDLSLRRSNLPFQINENDIMEFLRTGKTIGQ